jgi:hypothetical protein
MTAARSWLKGRQFSTGKTEASLNRVVREEAGLDVILGVFLCVLCAFARDWPVRTSRKGAKHAKKDAKELAEKA